MIVVQLEQRALRLAGTLRLPEKRYYTLREVCHAYRLPATTLRHWERSVPEIRAGRRGGRLFFQAEQLKLLAQFKFLVTEGGMTLDGARKHLVSRRDKAVESPLQEQLAALRADVRRLIDWLDRRPVRAVHDVSKPTP